MTGSYAVKTIKFGQFVKLNGIINKGPGIKLKFP